MPDPIPASFETPLRELSTASVVSKTAPEPHPWSTIADTDRCRFSGTANDGTCGQHAVLQVTVGCVHEHVYADVPICQYHVEEVAEGDSYCYGCCVNDGHDCPFLLDPRAIRDLEAIRSGQVGEVSDARL